jgi:hypothetical protein
MATETAKVVATSPGHASGRVAVNVEAAELALSLLGCMLREGWLEKWGSHGKVRLVMVQHFVKTKNVSPFAAHAASH